MRYRRDKHKRASRRRTDREIWGDMGTDPIGLHRIGEIWGQTPSDWGLGTDPIGLGTDPIGGTDPELIELRWKSFRSLDLE
ncbi:MAG TPA: hypothetical protein VGQ81_12405, partial [Acidobacteriota bacterium]|nr:hypothetical protein [Acidobacteriota bacterium]